MFDYEFLKIIFFLSNFIIVLDLLYVGFSCGFGFIFFGLCMFENVIYVIFIFKGIWVFRVWYLVKIKY